MNDSEVLDVEHGSCMHSATARHSSRHDDAKGAAGESDWTLRFSDTKDVKNEHP